MGKLRRTRSRKPGIAQSPQETRLPRIQEDPDAERFRWRCDRPDFGGPWGWQLVHRCDLHQRILKPLHDFEGMTWMQLQQGKKKAGSGSSIPVVKLHKKALARLEELGIEEEHLFEVRIDGFAAHPYPRIWGIRTGRYLNVLWWDPNHEVYHTDANKKERRRKDADPKARALPDQESCPPGIAGSSDRCPFCFVRESERT